MKVIIPDIWLTSITNASSILNPKEVAEVVNKCWTEHGKKMLTQHIGEFVLHQLELGKYEP